MAGLVTLLLVTFSTWLLSAQIAVSQNIMSVPIHQGRAKPKNLEKRTNVVSARQ